MRKVSTIDVTNTTKDKGIFKTYIPLNQKDGIVDVLEKKIGGDNGSTVKYLRGTATNTGVDKEDERMSKSFVGKIKKNIVGLNVFWEHEHSIDKTLGFVDDVDGDDDNVVIDTALENEGDNELVKKILNKIKHGTKIGYSIGGKITKAKKFFDESLKKWITEIEDGEIFEVSLTAMPAADGTWAVPIQKSLHELMEQTEIKTQIDIIDAENESNEDSECVKMITKSLNDMVEANKVSEQIWNLFYAFREALYKIVEEDELTPADKKAKIDQHSAEFSAAIETLSTKLVNYLDNIEMDLEGAESETEKFNNKSKRNVDMKKEAKEVIKDTLKKTLEDITAEAKTKLDEEASAGETKTEEAAAGEAKVEKSADEKTVADDSKLGAIEKSISDLTAVVNSLSKTLAETPAGKEAELTGKRSEIAKGMSELIKSMGINPDDVEVNFEIKEKKKGKVEDDQNGFEKSLADGEEDEEGAGDETEDEGIEDGDGEETEDEKLTKALSELSSEDKEKALNAYFKTVVFGGNKKQS